MRNQRHGKGPWILGCVALVPLVLLLGLRSEGIDRGRWNCEVCGLTEQRVEVLGVTCSAEPRPCGSAEYAAWWAAEVHAEHEHCWMPIGCHWRGNTVGCTMRYAPLLTYLGDPAAPTSEFRAAALALVRAADGERRELIAELFASVRRAAPEGTERVRDIAALRRRSPAWDRAIAAVDAASPR